MPLKNYKVLSTQYLKQISPQLKQKIESQAYHGTLLMKLKK